jgi:signal transduction histidine kinase
MNWTMGLARTNALDARLILDRHADALLVLDVEGRVVLSNRAARDLGIIELGRDDLAAFARRLLTTEPRAAPSSEPFGLEARADPNAEVVVQQPGAQPRRFELRGAKLEQHAVVTVRDVTPLRTLEEEARALQRFESVSLLTASVIHDLNNVLAAVLGLSTILRDVTDDGRAAGIADDLQTAVSRGTGLIGRVLAVARSQPPTVEHVNVSRVVGDLVPLLERLLGHEVELVVDLRCGADDTPLDRERLNHVVLNLICNSRDAMPNGGRLTISTREVILPAAPGVAGGAHVALSVTDTGTGMPPDVADRAFERFFTTKPPGRGTGLGLTSVHRFVVESGGRITLVSAPDSGTTVTLYLPRLGST